MKEKICKNCNSNFIIEKSDLEFYKKISPKIDNQILKIPEPSFCYSCRQQRKLSWRNERNLYKRKCSLTNKDIISVYKDNTDFNIIDYKIWFSDNWSGSDHGREFDFNKTFFEQFDKLHKEVPLPSLFIGSDCENSVYTNLSQNNRNCYYTFAGTTNEDCLYSTYLQRNTDIVDCFFIFDSELCHECIDCYECYNLKESINCTNCSDSYLLNNCIGCKNCIACTSLRNEEYSILNQKYSKQEYLRIKNNLDKEKLKNIKSKFKELVLDTPLKYYNGNNCENITGDHLFNCKDSYNCFDCTYLEDCKNCTWLHKSKDCHDCYAWGLNSELGYESHLIGDGFNRVCFSDSCLSSISNLLYCRYCAYGSDNLFGCVGLKKAKYSILNKSYNQNEYEKIVIKIINHMKETQEWGEFFPSKYSPFSYNETVAQEYFPLSKKEVLEKDLKWLDNKITNNSYKELDLNNVKKEDLLKEIYQCKSCKSAYKYKPQELNFYKKMELNIPNTCFDCRYLNRLVKRNPRIVKKEKCRSCNIEIKTTYSSKYKVCCEECYNNSLN